MKNLRTFLEKLAPYFSEGGRLQILGPFFDAWASVLYVPNRPTHKGPLVRDSLDVKRYMAFVILALLPITFFGIFNVGYQAGATADVFLSWFEMFCEGLWIFIPMIIVAYVVGFFWETLFASIRGHQISEGLLVSGLLFPLTLPPTISLWQVAIGFSFGIVIGKEIFGGVGRNFLNPALTGRAFIFFAYPNQMSGDSVWTVGHLAADAMSGATPLAAIALADSGPPAAEVLATAGYSLWDLLLGTYPGAIGGTGTLFILMGAVFLVVTGIASYKIMVGGILGAVVGGGVLNLLSGISGNIWFSLNPFYHLIMGGFLFGIVFMATDPVSAPGMENARWIYGFLIGLLTVLIRFSIQPIPKA